MPPAEERRQPQATRVSATPGGEREARRVVPERRGRRNAAIVARSALALVSVVVLATTWYGWSSLSKITSGLTTADVIDPSAKTSSGPQNILLVGIDSRYDAQGNPLPAAQLDALHAGGGSDGADATDTMMVVHIPAGGGRAVGFSIPRDSYVQLAGGYGMHKINSAYTYASNSAYQKLSAQGVKGTQLSLQAAAAGAKNSIQTVEQFTGLQINHYASVNLVGFYDISQAIGGVQVCLLHATKDSYSGANFPAGVQTIEGASALAFVRQRHNLPNGDLDREKRQQVFLAAAAHQILSAGVLGDPTKLNNLIGAIQKAITLDQGWNILDFAQQMQGMSAGAIQFSTIPIVNITYYTPQDGDAVEVDPAQVQEFAHNLISNADNPPASSSSTTTKAAAPAATTQNNAGVTATVYNDSGIAGLASDVMSSLTSQGFTSGGTGNGTVHRTATVVDYAPGGQADAQKVVTALGGGITMAEDSALSAGKVSVYLGTSYSGPKGGTASANSSTGTSSAGAAKTTSSGPPPITSGQVNCIN